MEKSVYTREEMRELLFTEYTPPGGKITQSGIGSIPNGGAARAASGDPAGELERFVREKMTQNPKLSYREAFDQVQLEHRDLAKKLLDQVRPQSDATAGSGNF